MTSRETWNATGSGNVNDSSSGICTSGIQGNYSNNFSSSYYFGGSANASGNYSIHGRETRKHERRKFERKQHSKGQCA
jgi:hypothetical protein